MTFKVTYVIKYVMVEALPGSQAGVVELRQVFSMNTDLLKLAGIVLSLINPNKPMLC